MATPQLAPAGGPLSPAPPPPVLDDTKNVEQVTSTAVRPKAAVQSPPQTQPAATNFSPEGLMQRFASTEKRISADEKLKSQAEPGKFKPEAQPQAQNTSPAEAWGSSAMALAAIGSIFTRQHLTTALNAAAGVMKAFKENDLQNAKMQFDQWKAANEMALKVATFQNDTYKAIMSNLDKDETRAIAETTAYGSAFRDVNMVQAAKDRNTIAMKHLYLDNEKLTEDLNKNAVKVTEGVSFRLALQDPAFQAKLKAAPDAKARGQMISQLAEDVAPDLAQASGLLSDETLHDMAEQRWAGDTTVGQNFGRGNAGQAQRARYLNMLYQVGREHGKNGADLAAVTAQYQGLKAGERTLYTVMSRIGLGASELSRLEPQVLQASAELKRTNFPDFNAVMQAYQRGTGDARVKNLAVRLQALKSAFSQVLTRGGATTDAARAATDELFATKDPDNVIQTSMQALNDETAAIKLAPLDVQKELAATMRGVSDTGAGGDTGGGAVGGRPTGPSQATFHGKPIWPAGTHWVYADGTEAK